MASLLPAIPAGATLYQRAVTNAIGATASGSNSLGYLGTNKSQLEVVGQLTGQDPTDWVQFPRFRIPAPSSSMSPTSTVPRPFAYRFMMAPARS